MKRYIKAFVLLFILTRLVDLSFAFLNEEEEAAKYIDSVRKQYISPPPSPITSSVQTQNFNTPVNHIRIRAILGLSNSNVINSSHIRAALENGKQLRCLAWILENVEEDLSKDRKKKKVVQETPQKDYIAKQLASMLDEESLHTDKLAIYTAVNSDLDALYQVIKQVKSLLKMEPIQLGFRCSEAQKDVFTTYQNAEQYHTVFESDWNKQTSSELLTKASMNELFDHHPQYRKNFICASVSPFSCENGDSAFHFWTANSNLRPPAFDQFFQEEFGIDLQANKEIKDAFDKLLTLSLKRGGQMYQLFLSQKALQRWTVPTKSGGLRFQYNNFGVSQLLMAYRQKGGNFSETQPILSINPQKLHNGGTKFHDLQARIYLHPDFLHLSSEDLIVCKYTAHMPPQDEYDMHVQRVTDLVLKKLLTAKIAKPILSEKFQIGGLDRLQYYFRLKDTNKTEK